VKHLLNGHPLDLISVTDRGIAYGDGLFETVSVIQREMPLWNYHVERLQAGCNALTIPWSKADSVQLRNECFEVLEFNGAEHGIIKIIVTRGEGGRGYNSQGAGNPSRIVSYFDAVSFPLTHYSDGITIKLCRTQLGHNPRLAGLKHLNRLEQVLATREWQGLEYDEGLMTDCNGDVIEATKSNLFLVKEGQLITPSLKACGVEGVMRRFLLERSLHLGLENIERRVSLDDLEQGEEVFVCNSVVGIWPVVKLAGDQLPQAFHWQKGAITERLQLMIQSELRLPHNGVSRVGLVKE